MTIRARKNKSRKNKFRLFNLVSSFEHVTGVKMIEYNIRGVYDYICQSASKLKQHDFQCFVFKVMIRPNENYV